MLKTSFGLIFKSPKGTEKKTAKRENEGSMCDSGGEASPKDGVAGIVSRISAEHEFHAQNDKSPGFHIAEALARENLCIQLFGGGDVPSTTIFSGFLSSPKDNACL